MKIYAEYLDNKALDQFNEAMEQDYTVDGALMPDAHAGYALPIGAVVSTKDVIVPAWVGYDIGCGMCALKTTFHKDAVTENKEEIFDQIYKTIPVGIKVNNERNVVDMGTLSTDDLTKEGQYAYEVGKGKYTLGTLGGGNHFIEIGYDTEDAVWIIIHSGSRGVGHKIATHYMKEAKRINNEEALLGDINKAESLFDAKNWYWKDKNPKGYEEAKAKAVKNYKPKVDKVLDGHYGLDVDSELGQNYINDMNWGLKFALANRKAMMSRVVKAMNYVIAEDDFSLWDSLINRNHNHAELKDDVWIHRKGATHADDGMMGVIPGNMRDGSFIVKGKGNPESLYSSSHGAGRVLGRKEANRVLDVDTFKTQMTGIQGKVDADTLDESPDAYKNIFDVMKQQEDLVAVITHVKPLINIKG